MLALAREFYGQQQAQQLFLGDMTIRQQKAKALDYCASEFLTGGQWQRPSCFCSSAFHCHLLSSSSFSLSFSLCVAVSRKINMFHVKSKGGMK